MRDVTNNNFGLLIAYVLPGLTVLWGASHFSATLQSWLASNSTDLPTVGGFLYITLGSVAAGMMMSTVRWLLVDGIHHLTGLKESIWVFSRLGPNVAHSLPVLSIQRQHVSGDTLHISSVQAGKFRETLLGDIFRFSDGTQVFSKTNFDIQQVSSLDNGCQLNRS